MFERRNITFTSMSVVKAYLPVNESFGKYQLTDILLWEIWKIMKQRQG